MSPHVTDQIDVLPPSIPSVSRLSLDPALERLGILDGGWWPRSRNMLLVIPPQASTAAAKSALTMGATGKNSGRPEEILAASGIDNEIETNMPRAAPDDNDRPLDQGLHSTSADDVRPMLIADTPRDERGDISRWLDDGASSP